MGYFSFCQQSSSWKETPPFPKLMLSIFSAPSSLCSSSLYSLPKLPVLFTCLCVSALSCVSHLLCLPPHPTVANNQPVSGGVLALPGSIDFPSKGSVLLGAHVQIVSFFCLPCLPPVTTAAAIPPTRAGFLFPAQLQAVLRQQHMFRMFPVGFILKECVNDVAKRVFLNVLNVCLANWVFLNLCNCSKKNTMWSVSTLQHMGRCHLY